MDRRASLQPSGLPDARIRPSRSISRFKKTGQLAACSFSKGGETLYGREVIQIPVLGVYY